MASRSVRKALIPAAGRGTRFLPFTSVVPKELAPIVTTPALDFVIAEAVGTGITDVLLVTSPEKPAIAQYYGDRYENDGREARIQYTDQLDPRGLGHAVGCGKDFAAGEAFAVMLPDDLIDARDELLGPMLDVQAEHGGVVIGLLDVPRKDISMYGSVALKPGSDESHDVVAISELVEKPPSDQAPSTLAIIGRYVLPPEIFAALDATEPGAKGEIQLTDAIQRLAHDGLPVHGVVFRGRRYDTGNGLDYMKSVVQLAVRHPDIGTDFASWLRDYDPAG